jgi:hypothetical protein
MMPTSGIETPMYCCEVRWKELAKQVTLLLGCFRNNKALSSAIVDALAVRVMG